MTMMTKIIKKILFLREQVKNVVKSVVKSVEKKVERKVENLCLVVVAKK